MHSLLRQLSDGASGMQSQLKSLRTQLKSCHELLNAWVLKVAEARVTNELCTAGLIQNPASSSLCFCCMCFAVWCFFLCWGRTTCVLFNTDARSPSAGTGEGRGDGGL